MTAHVIDTSGLVVLPEAECRRLLERGGVGRLALQGGSTPVLRPVNFALVDDELLVKTNDGPLWAHAQDGVTASFEIDEVHHDDHTAWSVLVEGRLRPVDEDEVGDDVPLEAWTPTERRHTVALSLESVSGRLMSEVAAARPAGPRSPAPPDADGVDPWGRSERARAVTARLLEPIARRWFRFTVDGLDHLPAEGGALLVANHAGAIPVDASLLMHVIERDRQRPVYALHHHALRTVPGVGTFLARNGGVVGHPDNALRLLRDEQRLVLVFPEGTKGTTKPFRDRYRLARFGRGGFVETAMRAGVPIVPIAVVGTEEAMPTLFRLPVAPGVQWPVTLNALLLGPAGAFVQFPVTIRARVLPPITLEQPPGLDRYPTFRVAEAAERVRATIQAAVDDLRDQRRAAS